VSVTIEIGGKKPLKATKGACFFYGILVFYYYARIWEQDRLLSSKIANSNAKNAFSIFCAIARQQATGNRQQAIGQQAIGQLYTFSN
jgi:hypothetical protein